MLLWRVLCLLVECGSSSKEGNGMIVKEVKCDNSFKEGNGIEWNNHKKIERKGKEMNGMECI